MKVFVTGVEGQLGHDVMIELIRRGYEVVGSDIKNESFFSSNYVKLDITNEKSVMAIVANVFPDVIIHCAAWTAVDNAEENAELVYRINALGSKFLASAANAIGSKILQVSTDYVFDGKGNAPFETYSPKGGLSIYGKTKSDAEDFVLSENKKSFIVRTAGVFGKNGNNFIKTMIKLANSGKKELYVVNDQIVSVTYTKDLACLLADIIETEKYGVYHAANEGYISWCDFAKEIFEEIGKDIVVHGISTDEYRKMVPGQANRPKNSRLSMKSLDDAGFKRLPNHIDALRRFLKEIGE